MNKHIALSITIVALGGCAADVNGIGSQKPPLTDGVSQPVEPDAEAVPSTAATALISEAPFDPKDVELTFAAVDGADRPIEVRGCRLLSRNPGDFTYTRMAGVFSPGCSDSVDGVTRLPVDENSEVAFTISAAGHPNYITQVTTDARAAEISHMPYRLLSSERIEAAYAAARIEPVEQTSSVVVETAIEGGVYELLLNTTDEGPAPIYLDAEGNAAPKATTSFAKGWVVFPNVAMGLHAVSFGHATERLGLAAGMGWAGCNTGDTLVWAIPGYASLVAAIERADGSK